ncbi:hypothetical protein NG885_07945 [Enterococcus faecium]|uniref:hypothetical protein n=1 Tax=Enterococcus faecium TaxID=1352 RepID=UPI00208FFE4C|nr:hypothetical protein [Enterococcus faecium]MCO5531599.1 hypothetical protein [Enterococcus faecium]
MMELKSFISEEITKEYLKPFLKEKGISNVSLSKGELLGKLRDLVLDQVISEKQYWEFIVRAFQYGYNRIFLTSIIEFPSTSSMLNLKSLSKKMKELSLKEGNFNDINTIEFDSRAKEPTIKYQNIETKFGKISKVELCYFSTINQTKLVDGEKVNSLLRVFDWVTIDFELKRFTIHTRNNGFNPLNESSTLRGIHNKMSNEIQKLFPFTIKESIHEKTTLYNIYKEMTDTAEKPFRDKVKHEEKLFSDFISSACEKLEYKMDQDTLDLRNRIDRLFERGLIEQNFQLYSEYFEGKLGIVQQIGFSDGTGAKVSAKVLDKKDNISNYEIYFDTRETLDKKKCLDKLKVTWYIMLEGRETKFDYDVKFVVEDNFYVTHFIGPYLTEEVFDFVFSRFREFEI